MTHSLDEIKEFVKEARPRSSWALEGIEGEWTLDMIDQLVERVEKAEQDVINLAYLLAVYSVSRDIKAIEEMLDHVADRYVKKPESSDGS
jgi:predicted glycosyl hydrolase (DUF1957 family)